MKIKIKFQCPELLTLLLVAFIILKLCGVITWPWLWVLSPLWIPITLGFLLMIIIAIVLFIK